MNFLLVLACTLACAALGSSRPGGSLNQDEPLSKHYKLIFEEIRHSRDEVERNFIAQSNENKKELLDEIWNLKELIEDLKEKIDESTRKAINVDCDIWNAAQVGDLAKVKECFNLDHTLINKREKDVDHWTPLIYASRFGYLDIVEFLVSNGANIEKTNSVGQTPLISAILLKKFDVVKYLIEQHANVNHQDKYKLTALHWAVSINNIKIVKLLTENGANKNLKDADGRTAMDIAKIDNAYLIEKYLKSQ